MNRLLIIAAFFALTFVAGQSALAQSGYDLFQKGLVQERAEGDLDEAIRLYKQIVEDFKDDRALAAKTLVQMGGCYEKLGRAEAQKAYQRVIEEYPGQKQEVAIAKDRIARLSKAFEALSHKPIFRQIRSPNEFRSDAQFSPDGKKIALGFEKKLWIMPRSGPLGPGYAGTPQLLNTGEIEVDNLGFTWSGDGRWIAFNRNQRIYVVSAEGGKPKQIHECNRDVRIVNYRMSLSPHGDTLAFASVDANELHIYTLYIDGGSPKRLVDAPAREPVFSPDGKIIAYVEDKNLGREGGGVWTVPADGGTPTLVANGESASSPIWSPDGRMIAFLDFGMDTQIYIVPIGEDGKSAGEKATIDCPEGIGAVKRLAGWTPDNEIGAILRTQIEYALYTQPVQGGQATFVTHGGYPLQPRWSPDGKQIYHTNRVREARGGWQGLVIARVPAEGGDVTTVPIQSEDKIVIWGYGTGNHVSPDGNTIVFAGGKSQESHSTKHIWTLPIEGGKPKQLTDEPSPFSDWYPCWSPGGKAIAFLRGPTSEDLVSNIYIIPANGGEPRQLTSESDMAFSGTTIAWSPDGKLLAYFSRDEEAAPDGTLKVIPVDGGEPRVVAKVKRIYANKEMAWSPDSKQIAFNETNVIKIVSLEDGNIVDTKPELEHAIGIYHLDWSPDGERLVFAADKGGGREFWLIENVLPEIEPKVKVVRQVWSGSDVDIEGSPSPDGKYLSYVDWDTGDLAVYEIATGNKRRLTNKGSWDESDEFAQSSRWSPDGKKIIYEWYNKKDFIDLYIVGLDGSKPRILYSNEEVSWAETYGWSPDGKEILACLSNEHGDQIVLVSVADGSVRVLKTLNKYHPQNISFSPDGRYIVHDFPQKEDSPESDISLLLRDGSREIPLIEHPADDRVLGWSPDGKHILITSDRTGTMGAWLIEVEDGEPQGDPELVKQDFGQRFMPMGFTKDGSFYYGTGAVGVSDVYIAKLDPDTGKVLIPPKKAIQRFEGHNLTPDYSPDGKHLAYTSNRGRRKFLCIRSVETGQEREFRSEFRSILEPRWSPDGNSILVGGMDYKGNRLGIYRIDIKTGTFSLVLTPPEGIRFSTYEWSPDGKSLFLGLTSGKDKVSQIVLQEIENGTQKEIYRTSDVGRFRLSCSPDGKWLAFISYAKKGALRIIPTAGGEPQELYKSEQNNEQLVTLRWTSDGKYIFLVIRQPEQKKFNLLRIPKGGGELQKLGLEMNIMSLSVHPDGQHIAFNAVTRAPAEVWIMDNFLPKSTTSK